MEERTKKAIAVILTVLIALSLVLNVYLALRMGELEEGRADGDIDDLEARISDLENRVSSLEGNVSQLQISEILLELRELQNSIDNITLDIVNLKQRLSILEAIIWGSGLPDMTLAVYEVATGFRIEVWNPTVELNLSDYNVNMKRNGVTLSGFPKTLLAGPLGIGPLGEYFNFTDVSPNEKLTHGDFFSVENVTTAGVYDLEILWGMNDSLVANATVFVFGPPAAVIDAQPAWMGYIFEVQGVSRVEALSKFKIHLLWNHTPCQGFPAVLTSGPLGVCDTGEYVNFTDLTGDNRLNVGDFFKVENLRSNTEYELVLLWAADDNKICSEIVYTP